MIDDDSEPEEEEGHGTHVAGTVDALVTEVGSSSEEDDGERERGDAGGREARRRERR